MRRFRLPRRAIWWAPLAVLAIAGSITAVVLLRPADSSTEPAPAPATARAAEIAGPYNTVSATPATSRGTPDRPLLITTASDPTRSGGTEGNFRIECHYSHQSYDDPIVFPGKVGAAHLHTFFGNSLANAKTTAQSLAANGDSTCHGGALNRSAYWIPAMLDTSGKVRVPKFISVYYKSAGLDPTKVQPMPVGLKMLAGDASAGKPQWDQPAKGPHYVEWSCLDASEKFPTIPACRGDLRANIVFPQCWDGKGLETTAVRYPLYDNANRLVCPAGFNTILPRVEYTMVWETGGSTSGWKLSSDKPNQPGGTTLHGDWFGAWDEQLMKDFVSKCINAKLDCQDGQLGDGRQLVRPQHYAGPPAIAKP